MGKVYSDQIQAETLEPMVLNPSTLNNYRENTLLDPKRELEVATSVVFDNGLIEKVNGTTIQNSDIPGDVVRGLHRAYGVGTEKVCLRLANGTLKSGPVAFATTVLSGLSTTKNTPFVNVRGKAYGVNETNGPIRYDPRTATGVLGNIVSPYLRKKIAFFESDEIWYGGTIDTGIYRPDEWTGNSCQSLKLAAATSNSESSYHISTVSPFLDLSQFTNGKTSTDNDLICFKTLHDVYSHIDKITVEFSVGVTTFTTKYMVTLEEDKFEHEDFAWTTWEVTKGSFATEKVGSVDWASIKAVRVTAYANANGPVNIWFDSMYMKTVKPSGKELRKQIFTAEDSVQESWNGTGVTLSTTKSKEGTTSVKITGGAARTAACSLTTPLDLTRWQDESTALATDEIVFDIYCTNIALLTNANCLQLRMGADTGNYYTYTWATKDALGLKGSNQWVEVRLSKSAFTVGVGAPYWGAISYISFITSVFGLGGILYIVNMRMEPFNQYKAIAGFESSENWIFTGNGEISTEKTGVTEGNQCIRLWSSTPGKVGDSYAVYTFPAVMDLTLWPDSTAADDSDYITFDLYTQAMSTFGYVEIWFDNGSASTFATAYKYRITKPALTSQGTKNNVTTAIKIKKSDFEVVGATGAWSTIGAIKVLLNASGYKMGSSHFVDNVQMRRRTGVTGRYYYKYCFVIKDVPSGCSEQSDFVDAKNSYISVKDIATSQDTRVTARWVFRQGGDWPDTWMLVKRLEDNTTTQFLDNILDSDLPISMGQDVPLGITDGFVANNLCYNPATDTMLYWGDPAAKNRVYESHPAYFMAVDQDGYRDFQDDVMGVIPWYGNVLIIYSKRIQIVSGSLMTGALSDVPVEFGQCSYWASKVLRDAIVMVGLDNVYLFNGYSGQSIGNEIQGYFKGRETYLSSVVVGATKDTVYIACKDKTGTPTYNNVVLRYYRPTSSWSSIPWNVNCWTNWDQKDDQNQLYYGSSIDGNIYSIDSDIYLFNTTAIASTLSFGWFNFPDSELRINRIELKARGTASDLVFNGYKNFGVVPTCTGNIALTTSWLTYTIGPKNIMNLLVGDALKIEFTHFVANAYFKIKDIVVYAEKIPKRMILNEVVIT